MDKQEYREFLDEIKKSYNAKNYEQVAAYADEMDFGKIKDPRILEMISDSYDHLGETDNAIDALVAAFASAISSSSAAAMTLSAFPHRLLYDQLSSTAAATHIKTESSAMFLFLFFMIPLLQVNDFFSIR